MYTLEANGISHSFDYPLFENVSLNIQPKESVAIIGSSGSGKSTLLHILSTLLEPNSGEVSLLGKNIYSNNQKQNLEIRREEIGIIFQAHYLFRGFNAYENIEIASILSNEEISNDLLEKLNIAHVMTQQVGELSGGQQQRVSIARVLTKKPKIIFADEPTGNLDKQTAHEVMDIIFEYINQNDASLIIVTHDEELASKCDFQFELKNRALTPLH